MSGPASGRRERAHMFRALLPCLVSFLALIAFEGTPARAQTMTPDLFRPVPGGFVSPQDLPMRRTAVSDGSANNGTTGDGSDMLNGTGNNATNNSDGLRGIDNSPAPSRIGQIPEYDVPAASGASDTGYDSLNRTRKQPNIILHQRGPQPRAGPGQCATAPAAVDRDRRLAAVDPAIGFRQQAATAAGDGRQRGGP